MTKESLIFSFFLKFVFIMLVSVTCIAWFSEDRPFAVGYFDGKLLLGTKEPLEKGGIVLIDAHKVKHLYQMVIFLIT